MLPGIAALFIVAIISGIFVYMANHSSPHAKR